MTDRRIIRVTGKGNIKVKPDMTRISMTLEGRSFDYEETLKESSEDTGRLKDILGRLGFQKEDVKTTYFNVDTKYESYQKKDKTWGNRFAGYEFCHRLKVEFDSDNERLGRILYALAHAKDIHPDFRLSYTVKDPEAAKNMLLGKAVEDAMEKARVLSAAAHVSLKEIQSIDYSWDEISLECSPMMGMMRYSDAEDGDDSYQMDIEPDDMEVSDTVTVVWEMSPRDGG